MRDLILRAKNNMPVSLNIEIYAVTYGYGNEDNLRQIKSYASDATVKRLEEGEIIKPLFSLDWQVSQKLMDDLWDCGIRPTEGSGSSGQLAATQRHLEDMRNFAFRVLPPTPTPTEGGEGCK